MAAEPVRGPTVSSDPRLIDDVIATRDEDGGVVVRFSSWVHPGQRLVLLAWIGQLLDAEPRTALVLRMGAGRVLGQTSTLAGRELGALMDQPELSAAERVRMIELVCAGR